MKLLNATLVLALLFLSAVSAYSVENTEPGSQNSNNSSVTTTKRGWLSVLWGDPPVNSSESVKLVFVLTDEIGQQQTVSISTPALLKAGGINSINGTFVQVELNVNNETRLHGAAHVQKITRLDEPQNTRFRGNRDSNRALTGSKPWITIACKFPDIQDEPRDINYFQGMYDNSPGRLDDYWREVSYNNINIEGSLAVDWVSLPNPQSTYVPSPTSGSNADLDRLFDDCLAVVDDAVDFSNGDTGGYEGINLMFNAPLDCCAWGGSRFATLDGISKQWRTTWNPPFSYVNAGVIAHEMGHGFGLPHANNSDNDSNPYDNPWDVMSAARRNGVDDPVYGRLGKHLNSYHKDELGWIEENQQLVVGENESVVVTVDPMDHDPTDYYRVIRIPIKNSSNNFYTIEVREIGGNYEAALPGSGEGDRLVIIHEVQRNRSQPSWVVDADSPPATFSDTEGVMWREGEVFEDTSNQIKVTVKGFSATGVEIQIDTGNKPIEDSDLDGVSDQEDNCTNVENPDQRDSNGDGYGNACDADLNNDGVINFVDVAQFSDVFLSEDQDADFNGDSVVNFLDLSYINDAFLQEPGPSGVAP